MKFMPHLFIFATLFANSLGSTNLCSTEPRCKCIPEGNNFEARCKNLGLNSTTFPHFNENVIAIDLSNNKIETMQFSLKEYLPGRLKKFEISNNTIQELTSFKDFANLVHLDLSKNKIQHFPGHESFPISLQKLNIASNIIGELTTPLKGLKNLTDLDLSSNQLQRIDSGVFTSLDLLRNLDLSMNRRLTFKVFRNISCGLQLSNVKVWNMNGLHCDAGVSTMLFVEDVECLSNSSLEELHLTYNRLGFIERGVLTKLPKSISVLDLSYNFLTVGYYLLEFVNMTGLKYLYAKTAMKGGNDFATNCHDWRGPYYKKIKTSYQHLNEKFLSLKIPPKLVDISIEGLNIGLHIGPYNGSPNNSLENINLSNNNFQILLGPIKHFDKLKIVNLSRNPITNISSTFFLTVPSMEKLILSNDFLGPIFLRSQNKDMFQNLRALKFLDISYNGISRLPVHVFKDLSSVIELNISHNYLEEWVVEIEHMRGLKWLDLSSNRISSLTEHSMDELNSILKQNNFTMTLNDNPLQCTCATITFIKWMYKNSHIFLDFESYACDNEEHIKHRLSNIETLISKMEKKCANHTALITGLLLAIVFSISTAVFGIIYRFRWKLRYMYYMGKLKVKRNGREQLITNHSYDFDAFVSYANEDREFVEGILRGKLEDAFNLELQLHARDFLAGKDIAQNITDAVHMSHKTVIILSRNYLKSYWCLYEFNMARMEGVYSRCGENVMIIVLLEKIRPRDMPLMMMDVIESDSYVEYPNNDEGNILFWDKLRRAIMTE